MCVTEYARCSNDTWAKSSSCIYISICVISINIYIRFDNSDDVIRHGPYLKTCIIYFRIVIYCDYAYAFLG